MKGTFLGCKFSNKEIKSYLTRISNFHSVDESSIFDKIAVYLDQGKVIGWFNGAMEFGPRALGGDQLSEILETVMQSVMNLKIKYREVLTICPFSIGRKISEQFELSTKSPYMLLVATKKELCKKNK